MSQPVLILVGGFLGAGKTTWLARAGLALQERGLSAGLITNDQAGQLVDTKQLADGGFRVEEVTGGCFCCRFEDLVSAAERLAEPGMPDVVLGEPVGSCTDLAATVLRPVRKYFPYAEGEAEMGWLNASMVVEGSLPDWRVWCESLLGEIGRQCEARHAGIGHVKLFLLSAGGSVVGNLTSGSTPPLVLVHGDPSAAPQARLILNARACLAPEELKALVEAAWTTQLGHGLTVVVENLECFRPGRPKPQHRLDAASCPIRR